MNLKREELINSWLAEERIAHIHGWDFSHINGRYEEEDDLPWDYRSAVKKWLAPDKKLLDIDTGGGEFLRSLEHTYENTAATENYPPNVELCRAELAPLGIDFRPADGNGILPFEDESFDVVINRHGDFNAREIWRVLRSGGVFITEQVGAENDRELVKLLLDPVPPLPFPEQYLAKTENAFKNAGFDILEAVEAYGKIKFYDIGALVWFARIIEWEFPGFKTEKCMDKLFEAQELLDKNGVVEGRTHRFFLIASK